MSTKVLTRRSPPSRAGFLLVLLRPGHDLAQQLAAVLGEGLADNVGPVGLRHLAMSEALGDLLDGVEKRLDGPAVGAGDTVSSHCKRRRSGADGSARPRCPCP